MVTPVEGPVVQAVYATGTVEATVMLPIAPRMAARLLELNADEGSRVLKDDVLAQLEDTDLVERLRELEAREAYALRDLERKRRLQARGVAAKEALDQAQTEANAATAAVKRAKSELDYMKLLAPADGMIIRRDGEIGELIPANQPVFWLSCCAPLRITAEVDEEDVSLVQPGQKVLIRADAFPDRQFEGRVQQITPKGDPVARSYRVRIGFTDEVPLLIGMTAEVNIITREKANALLVPAAALEKERLWLVEDGKLIRRKVKTGVVGEDRVEILEGVTPESEVAVERPEGLKEGDRVRSHTVETAAKSTGE